MKFTIKVPQKVSLNVAMRKHYRTVNKLKQDWHWVVTEAAPKRWKGTYPVDVLYQYFLKGKVVDSTNAGFMTKSLEDALVKAGVFPDDNPLFVRRSTNETNKYAKGDHVVVTITPCETSNSPPNCPCRPTRVFPHNPPVPPARIDYTRRGVVCGGSLP